MDATRMVSADEWRSPRGRRRAVRPEPLVVGPGYRSACLFAVGLVFVCAAVFGWWQIGDLSVHSRPRRELDFSWRAPDVPHWVSATLGPIALVVVVVTVGVVIFATMRHTIDRGWLALVVLAMIAGWMVAGIARVNTAGVIGADIGGGLALMLGGPIVLAMLAWIVFESGRIVRRGNASSRSA